MNLATQKERALNRKVHNRDIELIDELVLQFIEGTEESRSLAQAEILSYFNAYLEKYTSIFVGGHVDLSNYDTRGFLALFLTGRPKSAENFSRQRAQILRRFKRYSREDVKNELVIIFLGVLHKYRIYPGVNALNPLTKIFRWRVKDWYNRVIKDALFHTKDTAFYIGNEEVSAHEWIEKVFSIDVDFDKKISDMSLSWVKLPTQPLYASLSRYERYLLLLFYGQSMPISRIAQTLSRDKDTIKRHLTAIHSKLEKLFLNGIRPRTE